MFNDTFPGQNAPPDNYKAELTAIAAKLQTVTQAWGAKLAFAHTTPFICTSQQDGCVQTLNNWADEVMAAAGIPVLPTYEHVIAQCGAAPQAQCFGQKGCWCPHCNDQCVFKPPTFSLRALLSPQRPLPRHHRHQSLLQGLCLASRHSGCARAAGPARVVKKVRKRYTFSSSPRRREIF